MTTNIRLVVIKKFVNSINSLLPRLSEIRSQSAQPRIKRIYELFSLWDKTHLVVMKKFVNSFNSLLNKKALLSSRTTEPGKSKILYLLLTLKPIYVVCVVSLHIVFAQVAGRAYLVVHHVLNHHVLITELLDDDFIIRWVGMHATDIVV